MSAYLNSLPQAVVDLDFAATVHTDASKAAIFRFTATSNFTLANPKNMRVGQEYIWLITQDGTGSRLITYGSAFRPVGGAGSNALSTGAGDVDMLRGIWDGEKIIAVLTKDHVA